MREIVTSFLKIGLTAYGGPAIVGVMQAEFQDRRQWIGKPQFVEALAFVNMLPGATATQLGIFLGHQRGGWLGGLLAGLAFCAPAFAIMLALTASGNFALSTCGPCSETERPLVPRPISRPICPVRPNSIASITPLLPEPFGPEIANVSF
jgi:chromate transporter